MALALVTGGNRGIGLEVARELGRDGMRILLGSRDRLRGEAAGAWRVAVAAIRYAGILVNSVCPGWVRTDMGGAGASRSVEEGAASVLWAARLGPDGPTGGFFRDGNPVPW